MNSRAVGFVLALLRADSVIYTSDVTSCRGATEQSRNELRSYKKQTANNSSPYNINWPTRTLCAPKLVGFGLWVIALVASITSPALATSATEAFNKYKSIDISSPNNGYMAVAWSPDSKSIVYATNSGTVRVADITTGTSLTLPNLRVGLVQALAISHNKTLVAISLPRELLVVRISDGATLVDEKKATAFFGAALSFGMDDSNVLVSSFTSDPQPLLFNVDINTSRLDIVRITLPTALRDSTKLAGDDQLLEYDGLMFYVARLSRFKESIVPIGSNNPLLGTKPSTCIVFEVRRGGVSNLLSMYFPPKDVVDNDFSGRKDVSACRYSAGSQILLVSRQIPLYHLIDGVPNRNEDKDTILEAIDGRTGKVISRFGNTPPFNGNIASSDMAIDESDGKAVSLFYPGTSTDGQVVAWDLRTGREIGRSEIFGFARDVQFSPDGKLVTLVTNKTSIPIYRLTAIGGLADGE